MNVPPYVGPPAGVVVGLDVVGEEVGDVVVVVVDEPQLVKISRASNKIATTIIRCFFIFVLFTS